MGYRPDMPVVVITGASAGVGRAAAQAFARRGARLGLLARGRAGLEAACEEAARLGSPAAIPLEVDVADAKGVDDAAAEVEGQLGAIDVWVNNAMVSVFAPSWEVTAEEFARVTQVTYLGTVHGTLAALRRMQPRDTGVIVQVGSSLAYRGIPLQAAYCAAKHATQGFFDSVRAELLWANSGVAMSMVHLPALNTPQFEWVRTRLPNHPQPVPPIYAPEVAARAIVWASEHAPRELDVGAPTMLTRLANKVAPGVLDRYLARNGVQDQQTDEPIDAAGREDNLDRALDDDQDYGPYGRFGDQSRQRSLRLQTSTHKMIVGAGLAGAAALGLRLARTLSSNG
jgi:NAD(P)-dependent dehydrogenase (short-subunit alcohol dehydrogenase family)